jgi:hypothetical protein
MIRLLSFIFVLFCSPALAQTGTPTKQSGSVTPSHATCWTTNGIVQDCGTAAVPFLTSIGTVGQGQTICAWSALSTAPGSQKICLSVTDAGGASLVVQNFGTDTALPFNFVLNGITYPFPFTVGGIVGPGSSTSGDIAVWNNTTGSLLKDVPPLQVFGTQTANTVLAGPTTGSAANPAFRALVAADIPTSSTLDSVCSTNSDSLIRLAGTWQCMTYNTAMFAPGSTLSLSTAPIIGTGTGDPNWTINGGASGSGNGGFYQIDLNGNYLLGLGNVSGLEGGTFDANTILGYATGLYISRGTPPSRTDVMHLYNSSGDHIDMTAAVAILGPSFTATGLVTNADLANMASLTIKGNNGNSLAAPSDLTVPQVITLVAPGSIYTIFTTINFNSATTDTGIAVTLPFGLTRFQIDSVTITNASHTLTTATAGVFTTTGGSGAIAADQAITVSSTSDAANNNSQRLTLTNASTESYVLANLAHTPNLYFRVGTPESAAATADVTIVVRPLP